LGSGCFVPEGCVLGADLEMGDFVTLRYGAILGHEVEVQNFVLIGPGATVGAGAVVARPVATSKTVAGVPVKELVSIGASAPS
jgi:serine acetyltransferase